MAKPPEPNSRVGDMSEYQHYQFDVVDRTLSSDTRKAVSKLSSHISVSQSNASVEYHYSNFKHDPLEVLARYFDLFTYEANWGDQRLAFRFDSNAIALDVLNAFAVSDVIDVKIIEGQVIVDCWFTENYVDTFHFEEDDYYEDRNASISPYVPFYSDILEGDYRSLFLLWLRCLELGYVNESTTMIVPEGLNQLQETHQRLLVFIGLGDSILEVAQNYSKTISKKHRQEPNLQGYLRQLTQQEKDAYMESLLSENPSSVKSRLRAQLSAMARSESQDTPNRLNIDEPLSAMRLREEAKVLTEEKTQAVLRAEEDRKQNYLQKLKQNEAQMWAMVPVLIEEKKTKSYLNAALTLQALKYLSESLGELNNYYEKADAIVSCYPKLTGMRERMEHANLVSSKKEKHPLIRHREMELWMQKNPPDKEYPFTLFLK